MVLTPKPRGKTPNAPTPAGTPASSSPTPLTRVCWAPAGAGRHVAKPPCWEGGRRFGANLPTVGTPCLGFPPASSSWG